MLDDTAIVRHRLISALTNPTGLVRIPPRELDLTLRLVRRVRLLGRLAADLKQSGVFAALPQSAKDQLDSALIMAAARERVARWELDRIAWVLEDSPDLRLICLKGCAYLLLETPNTRGRSFADVDLLVPEDQLPAVENRLNAAGWPTASQA